MEESRTLVLVATMRSPTIGSPDQTQKRAHCAKKHRPRRATAPDFPACAGVPRDHGTQKSVAAHIGDWNVGFQWKHGVPSVWKADNSWAGSSQAVAAWTRRASFEPADD
jgi:hypothetical protein